MALGIDVKARSAIWIASYSHLTFGRKTSWLSASGWGVRTFQFAARFQLKKVLIFSFDTDLSSRSLPVIATPPPHIKTNARFPSQHGNIMTSQHGNIMTSQHGNIMTSQHGNIMTSQHGNIMTPHVCCKDKREVQGATSS